MTLKKSWAKTHRQKLTSVSSCQPKKPVARRAKFTYRDPFWENFLRNAKCSAQIVGMRDLTWTHTLIKYNSQNITRSVPLIITECIFEICYFSCGSRYHRFALNEIFCSLLEENDCLFFFLRFRIGHYQYCCVHFILDIEEI